MSHPVGRFVLPLFAAHDRRNFEIFCYGSDAKSDALTTRLRDHCDRWHDMAGMNDESLADLVRQDLIDVLVDLEAHLIDNRLLTFARKPAPVQVTYLAYCSTTGLRAMDYRLTDPFLDPLDQPPFCSEESAWLPETYWCYQPLPQAPLPGPLPAVASGHVTFGCLNNFCKVTLPTLTTWRDLLVKCRGQGCCSTPRPARTATASVRSSPRGTSIQVASNLQATARWLNISRAITRSTLGSTLSPYGGGTTTCDALWMGVPVISLAGKTAMGRAGFEHFVQRRLA